MGFVRLSLDLDHVTYEEAMLTAESVYLVIGVHPDVWETRKGFHIETEDIGLTFKEQIALRFLLGDDLVRIKRDLDRWKEGKATDFLFHIRRGKRRKRVT